MIRASQFVRILIVPILVTLVAGCSFPLHALLYNASGGDVTIAYSDEQLQLVNVPVSNSSEGDIEGLLDAKFTISGRSGALRFTRAMVSEEYVESGGMGPFFKRTAKVQLEADGCLYLVPVTGTFPVKKHAGQPAGFPHCGEK